MQVLKLVQGTDEWLKARLQHFTASEAPAMMGDSKYMSRNQLLALKKGWLSNPDNSFLEKLYKDGHEFEDQARPIIEMELLSELPPLVCSEEISGMLWLSSYDGFSIENWIIWEHKGWNETLAENVRNGVLEPHYYWQLEHQMLVAGIEQAVFTVSNGTTDKKISMTYKTQPERRLELIAGWKQFDIDLDEYVLKAKEETVVAAEVEAFPLVEYEVKGTDIVSNVKDYLELIRTKSQFELTRVLETDQDFLDKNEFNKATKQARADLKQLLLNVQGQFVSYAEFATTAKEIDSVLQKMQSHGEKQVKEAKEAKKEKIIITARKQVQNHVESIYKVIEPIKISDLMETYLDFTAAMKNKRTIVSLQDAADGVVAQFKIESNQIANNVQENLITLRELASDYKFLFSDTNQLVTKTNEDLVAVIKTRIAEHKEAEEAKLEIEREAIRLEEEAKAKKKIEDEEAAKKQAEQEAEEQKLKQEQAEEAGKVAKESAEKREAETEKVTKQPDNDKSLIDGDGSTPYNNDPMPYTNPCKAPYEKKVDTLQKDVVQTAFSNWWDEQLENNKEPILMDAFKAGAIWQKSNS